MFRVGLKSVCQVGTAGTFFPFPPSLAFEVSQTLRVCFIKITPLLDHGFGRSGLGDGILMNQEGDKEKTYRGVAFLFWNQLPER